MNYDTLIQINQTMNIYSVNSLNVDESLDNSYFYNITEMDTINIVGFNGLNENIDTTWDHDDNPSTYEITCLCHHTDPEIVQSGLEIDNIDDCGENMSYSYSFVGEGECGLDEYNEQCNLNYNVIGAYINGRFNQRTYC